MIIVYSSDHTGKEILETLEFPVSKAQYPFLNAVKILNDYLIEPLLLPSNYNYAHFIMSQYLQGKYVNELIWVLRDYFKTRTPNQAPFNSNIMRAHRSGGNIKTKRFDLCCGILEHLPELLQEPIQLWTLIELEIKWCEFIYAFEEYTKRELEDIYREQLRKLKRWENPYFEPSKMHAFIQIAINIGKPDKILNKERNKKRKEFINNYWQPYLNAFEKFIKDLDEGTHKCKFVSLSVKGTHLVIRLGGRRTQTIYSPRKANLSNRGVKYQSIVKLTPNN